MRVARMQSLVLCYAPEDEAFARRVGSYLAANLPLTVSYDEGRLRPDFDLIDSVEIALSAEIAVVLLSAASMPRAWERSRWNPVFFTQPEEFGTLLAYVQLGDCKFPELFRRERFFDGRENLVSALRLMKRWLLRPEQKEIAPLSAELPLSEVVDLPGITRDAAFQDAMEFAAGHEQDFQAVYALDLAGRSNAGALGDLGHAIGLRLSGTVQENRGTLAAYCATHRTLLIISHASPESRELLSLGGRASVLFLTDAPTRRRATVQEVEEAFISSNRDAALCAMLLGDAAFHLAELLDTDFEFALRFGWAMVGFLQVAARYAEVIETLGSMEQAALLRDDASALFKIKWELSWLGEASPEDGEVICILPTAGEEAKQLSLFG